MSGVRGLCAPESDERGASGHGVHYEAERGSEALRGCCVTEVLTYRDGTRRLVVSEPCVMHREGKL